MSTMFLKWKDTDEEHPQRIECYDNGRLICTVYVDGEIVFGSNVGLYAKDLKEICTIANNFHLFANNI